MTNFPSPPLITPHQMNILRAATAMAWADGQLEPGEIYLILDQFAVLFSKSESQQVALKAELAEYLGQNIPLEEVIPSITTDSDRALVLKLGYQVISSSRRTPEEAQINPEEAEAYQKLISLLGLSANQVAAIEAEINPSSHGGADYLISNLAINLHNLIA
jgi:tellurite resistance protein